MVRPAPQAQSPAAAARPVHKVPLGLAPGRVLASEDIGIDGHPSQRDPGRGIERVAQRGRCGRGPGLADATGKLAAWNDVYADLRRLIDAHRAIVVEVRLLDAAVLER